MITCAASEPACVDPGKYTFTTFDSVADVESGFVRLGARSRLSGTIASNMPSPVVSAESTIAKFAPRVLPATLYRYV